VHGESSLDLLRAQRTAPLGSGRRYTIVRPSWLTDDRGGDQAIHFEQGDAGEGEVARTDVAAAVVAALRLSSPRSKTFEIYDVPGAPPRAGFDALLIEAAVEAGARLRERPRGGAS
jgi:hypothetical protein